MESNYTAMVEQMVANQTEEHVFDNTLDELVGFGCVQTEDYEQEYTVRYCGYVPDSMGAPVWTDESWTDDVSSAENRWFTTSGDNPVIRCEAENVKGSRLSWEEQAPDKQFYSAASPMACLFRQQERNFHVVLRFVRSNADNSALLQKGWARMWKRVYAERSAFLSSRDLNTLRGEFRKLGIVTQKERAAQK